MSDLQGADKLATRLQAIGHTEVLLRTIVIRGVAEAKHLVPRRTGNLGRTIRPGAVTATSGEIRAGGQLKVGYAVSVERGTRPHIIRPKAGRVGRNGRPAALAWGGERRLTGTLRSGAKATNFAREVNHPGTKAHPFLVPGLQAAARKEGVTTLVTLWNRAS